MLLLVDTLLLAAPALALAGATRPRSASGWLAALGAFLAALIIFVSETAGRVSYSAWSLTAASAVAGAAGVAWLAVRRQGAWRRLASGGYWSRRARAVASGWPGGLLAVWAMLVIYSAAAVVVLPPTVPDALRYHLPMVVGWYQEGRVGAAPLLDYRAAFFPHVVEILNGWCFMLGGERMMGAPQVAISGLVWPLVSYMAIRGCGVRRRWSMFGALLASMNAPVVLQMRNELNDVGFYAAFLLALVAGLGRSRLYRRSWPLIGAAAGLALGAKSSGALAAAVVAAACAAGLWSEARRWRRGIRWRRALPGAAGAAAIALAVGGWVYGANLAGYGNPFYPIALRIGPWQLASPDDTYAIYYNSWLTDFGVSPLARLLGGMARWPRLLLGLPPFDAARSAAGGGFGWMVPACVVGAAGVTCLVVARSRSARPLRAIGGRALLLLGALAVWNVVLLSFVSVVTEPRSLVDARYQLHFALVFPLLLVALLPAMSRMPRAVVALGLAGVFAITARDLAYQAPERGFKVFREVVLRGRDRSYVYSGRTFFVASDPAALMERIGDGPLLVANRGRVYPFYVGDFQRKVYAVSIVGPSNRSAGKPDVPAGVYAAGVENYRIWYDLAARSRNDPTLRPFAAHFWRRADARRNAVAFLEAMARRYGARYLYCQDSRSPALDESPSWREVMVEPGKRPDRPRMILYEYLGPLTGD